MKTRTISTIFLSLFLLASSIAGQAQTTPEALLARLPAVPTINCAADTSEVNRFTERIYEVKSMIQAEVDRIHASAKSDIVAGDIGDLGIDAQSSQKLYKLATEQNEIGDRITERMTRISNLFVAIEMKDTMATKELKVQMKPWEEQLCSGICTPAEVARSNAAEKQIYALKIKYCEKMSPLQTDAITQYLTTLKGLFADYRRLADVQNETIKMMKVGEIVPKDLSCYTALDEYATALLDSYKYWVGKSAITIL